VGADSSLGRLHLAKVHCFFVMSGQDQKSSLFKVGSSEESASTRTGNPGKHAQECESKAKRPGTRFASVKNGTWNDALEENREERRIETTKRDFLLGSRSHRLKLRMKHDSDSEAQRGCQEQGLD
jgi:hypothetical protein